MFFHINDLVTRKSYHNDIVFIISCIKQNSVVLKGYDVRLIADSDIEDLILYEDKREANEEILLPIRKGNYLNGKVLHLDSDIDYLKKSMNLYEKYKVPAI